MDLNILNIHKTNQPQCRSTIIFSILMQEAHLKLISYHNHLHSILFWHITVKPPIVDPLRKGHCMLDLSIKDIAQGPKITLPMGHREPPRRGQPLHKGQNSWIYIVPKVSFIWRFHCIVYLWWDLHPFKLSFQRHAQHLATGQAIVRHFLCRLPWQYIFTSL